MKTKVFLICAMILFGFAAGAAGDTDDEYKKLPGYVSFESLKVFGDREAKIEVYLKTPMLELVSKFVKSDDPELYAMLSKLKLVRVQVFDVDYDLSRKFAEESSKTVKELDKKGWEQIVRVNEDEERVYIYVKPSKEYESVQGIVVLVVGDDDEAVFINIVGDIHPDDIARLGEHFEIEELDSIRYEMKKH